MLALTGGKPPFLPPSPFDPWVPPCCGDWKELAQDSQGSRFFSCKACSHLTSHLPRSRQALAQKASVTGSKASPNHLGDILEKKGDLRL